MNHKGQIGTIGLIIMDLFFLINWGTWLSVWLTNIGQDIVLNYGITGIEGFLWANLNLIVFLAFILGNLLYFSVGGSGQ